MFKPTKVKWKNNLREVLDQAPEFPMTYDDHVLTLEKKFRPEYRQFLLLLRELAK